MGDVYRIGFLIVGILAFVAGWIYAIATWGFFLGVAFGWIPAAIIGVIVGAAWPLVVAAVAFLAWLISR